MKSSCFQVVSNSLSGAIEALAKNGNRVALVSHRSSPKIFDHQKHLVAKLRQRFPGQVMHIPVLATRQGPLRIREHTQRTRSFLYAALGCVVARLFGNGSDTVFREWRREHQFADLSAGGRRARNPHHPSVGLERYREFFSTAIGRRIDVENSVHLENQIGGYSIHYR